MSIKLMSKIWEHPELARGQTIVTKDQKEVDQQNKLRTMKLVLLCLADMANDDGVCWPSNKTIAERANLTPDYVRSLIGTLKANDWLAITERFSETGKQTSNWITLNTAKIYTPLLSTPPVLSTPLPRGTKSTPYPSHLVGGTIEPSLETKREPSITPIDSLPKPTPTAALTKPQSDDRDGKMLMQKIRDAGFFYLDSQPTMIAMQLESDYTDSQLVLALGKAQEAHQKQIKTGSRGITAPLAYMRQVLLGMDTAPVKPSGNSNGNGASMSRKVRVLG